MLCWGLLLLFFVTVKAEELEFSLGDKWEKVISGPEGSQLWEENTTWTITTDPESTIKVYCEDFRFPIKGENFDDCTYAQLTFDDGENKEVKCGYQRFVQVLGKSSKMTINLEVLVPGVGGFLYCHAKAVRPPTSYEDVEITPGEETKRIVFPEETRGDNDKAWRFKSTTSDKINLICRTRLERPMDTGECVTDLLTIDSGNGPQEICGFQQIVIVSNEIKMRFETFPTTEASIDCLVRSADDDMNEDATSVLNMEINYENLEDSESSLNSESSSSLSDSNI